MESLGHENRTCDRQVLLAGDQGGTAEVGGSANTLKDRRQSDEALHIGVREGVFACFNRSNTCGLQSPREELNMLLLVVCNVLQVVVVVFVIT